MLEAVRLLPTRVEKETELPYKLDTVIKLPENVIPEAVDIVNRFAKTVEQTVVEKTAMVFILSEFPVNSSSVLFIPWNVLVASVD
jgi:hypothetical protein